MPVLQLRNESTAAVAHVAAPPTAETAIQRPLPLGATRRHMLKTTNLTRDETDRLYGRYLLTPGWVRLYGATRLHE